MTGHEIRLLREALGLSPEKFGIKLGLTEKGARSTVWRWETKKTKPSPQTIMLIQQLRPRRGKKK
jgi:transcriptional regulator with XRE-family HTH domain